MNESTDYLTIPGAQLTRSEREFLKNYANITAQRFRNPIIVTVGVLWAANMWCFKRGAPNAIQYGVDIKLDKNIHRRKDLGAHFIIGDSTRVWKKFDKQIHLLFIDGDHHYDTVKLDIAGWVPKMIKNGIVIFHDYSPTDLNLRQFPHIAGVKKAVDEWRARGGLDWIGIEAPDSLKVFQKDEK